MLVFTFWRLHCFSWTSPALFVCFDFWDVLAVLSRLAWNSPWSPVGLELRPLLPSESWGYHSAFWEILPLVFQNLRFIFLLFCNYIISEITCFGLFWKIAPWLFVVEFLSEDANYVCLSVSPPPFPGAPTSFPCASLCFSGVCGTRMCFASVLSPELLHSRPPIPQEAFVSFLCWFEYLLFKALASLPFYLHHNQKNGNKRNTGKG